LRPLSLAFALVLGLSIASGAAAKATQCKDAKGKFIKCPPAAAAPATPATTRCKDAKGKFTKCGGPAAAPTVSAPAATGGPAGATAKCKDGTFSSSKVHSGSCSHHGGVASWLH